MQCCLCYATNSNKSLRRQVRQVAQTQLLALEKLRTIADHLSTYAPHAQRESERLFFCTFSNLEVAKVSAVDKIKPRNVFFVVLFDSRAQFTGLACLGR